MLNAAKNTANKNSKKKKKDATSTIQGCESRDCTIKGIQSSPKYNPKTVATTKVTVSGQPPARVAPSSSTMCTESADGQPPPQSSSTMCTQSAGGQLPPTIVSERWWSTAPAIVFNHVHSERWCSTAYKTLAFEDWSFPSDKS